MIIKVANRVCNLCKLCERQKGAGSGSLHFHFHMQSPKVAFFNRKKLKG